jgi:anti-anti-sigma factor
VPPFHGATFDLPHAGRRAYRSWHEPWCTEADGVLLPPVAVGGSEAHMDPYPTPRSPVGSISIEHEAADRHVLCLSGEVDTAVATEFTRSQGRDRVAVDAIDAGDVTFISSSGIALMLVCVEVSLAAGRRAVLRASSRVVDRALQLAGIDGVFPRPEPDTRPPPPSGSPAGAEKPPAISSAG